MNELKEILDKLHRFSFGEDSEMERTDIAFMVEQLRDELEFRRTAIIVADMERMDNAIQFMQERERIWDAGREAVIHHALQFVENEPEHLAGYIDQHVIGVGGSRLRNPYARSS